MRILFIVPYSVSRRVRPRRFIRGLARRGHDVTVATLWKTGSHRSGLRRLQSEGIQVIAEHHSRARALWNCLRALPTGQPLQARYSWNPALAHAIENVVRVAEPVETRSLPFDVIHIEHLRGARYGLLVKTLLANGASNIPIVWDSVDCITYLFEQASSQGLGLFPQIITRLELPRTRRYEGWLLGQFDRHVVTSEVDRQALAGLADPPSGIPTANSRITVVTNGVDLGFFAPQPREREPETLVFMGRMSYHANVAAMVWFSREVLPRIWADRPNVRLFIVGWDPGPAVRALGRDPRIVVTGTVPDVRLYLARAALMVAPMVYGAGVQNKVLQALASETAVVTTSNAAVPLCVEPDQHLLIADTEQAFAQAVLRLLANSDLRARIGRAGRHFVEQHHDWNQVAARLEGVYIQAIEERRSDGNKEV